MTPCKALNKILAISVLAAIIGGCSIPARQTGPAPAPSGPENVAVPQARETRPAQADQTVRVGSPIRVDQPPYEKPVVSDRKSPDQPQAQLSHIDREFAQNRLNDYRKRLDQWVEITNTGRIGSLPQELSTRAVECMQLLKRILTGYSGLVENMPHNEAVSVGESSFIDPEKIQQLDITFLESQCDEILTKDIPAQLALTPTESQQYSFKEYQEIIKAQMDAEKYSDTVRLYSSMLQDYPERQPDITTRLSYGLALQYSGQAEAAAKQFGEILASGDLAINPLNLRLKIADLFLASGDIDAAKSYYNSFIRDQKPVEAEKSWAEKQLEFLRSADPASEDMLAYTKLLHDFLADNYRIHGAEMNEKIDLFAREHTGSPVAVSALRLKDFATQQLNFWFGSRLVRIDKLVAEKKYAEATDILKNMSNYYLPPNLQAVVQKTHYEIAQAEIQETEKQQQLHEMELNQKWDAAVRLMDSQRFAESISAFEKLKGTEYEEKANSKIVEAANLAAGQMRKEAASLFIQAGKTSDVEEKKELLIKSYKLLTEIPAKFPQTDLLDKVQQNIAILEEQINKFDPALLEELKQKNDAGMPEAGANGPLSQQENL